MISENVNLLEAESIVICGCQIFTFLFFEGEEKQLQGLAKVCSRGDDVGGERRR